MHAVGVHPRGERRIARDQKCQLALARDAGRVVGIEIGPEAVVQAAAKGTEIPLPTDVVVAKEFSAKAEADVKAVAQVAADEMILDVGPAAVEALGDALKTCRTLVWNGPMGAFEIAPFDTATVALAEPPRPSSTVTVKL
mgnify:CR=1 FL=1